MSTFLVWFGNPYSHCSVKLHVELPVIHLLEKQTHFHKIVEMQCCQLSKNFNKDALFHQFGEEIHKSTGKTHNKSSG